MVAGWQRIINDHQRMMVQWHHTHHTSCACGALVETTELLLALISIMQQAGGDMRRLRGDKEVDDEVDVLNDCSLCVSAFSRGSSGAHAARSQKTARHWLFISWLTW